MRVHPGGIAVHAAHLSVDPDVFRFLRVHVPEVGDVTRLLERNVKLVA